MNTKKILGVIAVFIMGFILGSFWCSSEKSEETNQENMHDAMRDMAGGLHGKTGDAFDQAFLSEMIVHHEGAIEMAETALMYAKHDEIKRLAHAIIAAQTEEIENMRQWENVWYKGGEDTSVSEITNTSWTWRTTVIGGDTTIEPSSPDTFTVTFHADGKVSGTTDCNSFSGTYAREGDVVTIGQLASTKMFCPDSQESQFTDALTEGPLTVSFEGEEVLVLRFSESTALFFDRKR